MDDIHVLPVNDILEHQECADCWCDPEIEVVGATLLIIHNSFDGREYKEIVEDVSVASCDEA